MTPTDVGRPPSAAEIADRLAIQDVIFTHSRGIDRCDRSCIESAYWPEAEVAYGAFDGRAHDFAAMIAQVLQAGFELTQHVVSNVLIQLDGHRARSESYVTAYHLHAGAEREMIFSGRYLDLHERREERWKILHRQVVMDWSREHAVDDQRDATAFGGFAKGARLEGDPLDPFLNRT